ncbi:MAG: hypothetical protein ACYC3Q_13735 [Gemmatimonadaceae bacterium]
MADRELYQAILGLTEPWTVERVELKAATQVIGDSPAVRRGLLRATSDPA